MADKLELLTTKFEKVLELVDKLKAENQVQREENSRLRAELTRLQTEVTRLRATQNDQSDRIKDRLTAVLAHVQELEGLTR